MKKQLVPNTKTLTEYIAALGAVPMEDGRPALLHLAIQIWNKALDGDKAAMQMVYDRLEGRVPIAEAAPVPKEPLSDELERALDKVYGNSEGGRQPKGTDT